MPTPSAGDIRAELARRRVKLYTIAPRVGMHPANLSVILNEHRPLAPDLAERIMRAILDEPQPAA